jgi:hypothetical protein
MPAQVAPDIESVSKHTATLISYCVDRRTERCLFGAAEI